MVLHPLFILAFRILCLHTAFTNSRPVKLDLAIQVGQPIDNGRSLLLLEHTDSDTAAPQAFTTCGNLGFVTTTEGLTIENIMPGYRNDLNIEFLRKDPLEKVFIDNKRPVVYNPRDQLIYMISDSELVTFNPCPNVEKPFKTVAALDSNPSDKNLSTISINSLAIDDRDSSLFWIEEPCQIIKSDTAHSFRTLLHSDTKSFCNALNFDKESQSLFWVADSSVHSLKLAPYHDSAVKFETFAKPIISNHIIVSGGDLYYLEMEQRIMKVSLVIANSTPEEVFARENFSDPLISMQIVPELSLTQVPHGKCFSCLTVGEKIDQSIMAKIRQFVAANAIWFAIVSFILIVLLVLSFIYFVCSRRQNKVMTDSLKNLNNNSE